MGLKRKFTIVAGGLCVGLLAIGHANAATVYSGTLSTDDQVQTYTYTAAQASNVVFESTSYATGGFVPVISLFNSSGVEIGSDGGDGTCGAGMTADSGTKMCDDAYLSENLATGSYTLAISEFPNVPVGPNYSNGFLFQGQGNFTGATCGTTGGFYETDIAPCVQRTDAFSVTAMATPEPSTLWLGALPLIFLGVIRRRKNA